MKGYLSTPGVSRTEELDSECEGVIVGLYRTVETLVSTQVPAMSTGRPA